MTTLNRIFILFLCTALLALNACGFKLRSYANSLPPELKTLYLNVDNPYGSFESLLKQALHSSGVTLVALPAQAPFILNTSKPVLITQNTTIGNTNEARVYNVNYSVKYSITDRNSKTVLPPQEARATRSLTLNANQLLESNNQLTMLTREMQREVITKIFNFLNSQEVAEMNWQ
ncbi:MAG: rlpB [Gammaproteobacteria bacterium]|nr:rlpB [Gammaproteobacteria bacterium]